MAGDQLHGVTESLQRAAQMAGNVSGSIEGHRSALRPIVDSLKGQWEGTARPAFDSAHAQWEAGITRLNAALNNLGDSTRHSGMSYEAADQTGSAAVNSAMGASPFAGALRG